VYTTDEAGVSRPKPFIKKCVDFDKNRHASFSSALWSESAYKLQKWHSLQSFLSALVCSNSFSISVAVALRSNPKKETGGKGQTRMELSFNAAQGYSRILTGSN
jgi:hypothetical protein